MKTRRVTLSPDHVTALSLIQTEFHDDGKVISAYKVYIENLKNNEIAPNADDDEIRRFVDKRDDVFNEMMFEIGRHLGFNFDKRELSKYSYAPQGWVNMEAEQNALRTLALELLQGRRPLPVAPFQLHECKQVPTSTKYICCLTCESLRLKRKHHLLLEI